MMNNAESRAERLIKKYPNRRLYDTGTSSYITLDDVKQLVLEHVTFRVVDAKTGEDLTRNTLLQIILEEEASRTPIFSSAALESIIRYYGHTTQGMMGAYLEKNIQAFIDMQSKLAESSRGIYDAQALNPEAWAQLMAMQAPATQDSQEIMRACMEQGRSAFLQMQEQLQNHAKALFELAPLQPSKQPGPKK